MAKARYLPEERIVAFIDIMGFQSIVERMPHDPLLFDSVRGALKSMPKNRKRLLSTMRKDSPGVPKFPGLDLAHFSDSIVLSADMEAEGSRVAAEMVIGLSALFMRELLDVGIPVRGGISHGWTYHNENVLFGQGVIAAYELEKQVSRVPRIVVSDFVADLVESDIKLVLRRDSDGFHFINPLAPSLHKSKGSDGVQQAKHQIEEWLLEYATRPELLSKYRWLAVLYNEMVRESKGEGPFNGAKAIKLRGDGEAPL